MMNKRQKRGVRAKVAKLIGEAEQKKLLELKPTLRNYLLLRTY